MFATPRVRLSWLRIVVLSLVLALFPGRAVASAAPIAEVPALVLAAAPPTAAEVFASRLQEADAPRVAGTGFEWGSPGQEGDRRNTHLDFVRLFERYLTQCAWLC